ncbi:MAG: hypothetical protein WA823_00195 [Candidatus Acidiferrales bacterium]
MPTRSVEGFREYERVTPILKRIAAYHQEGSEEYDVLKRAPIALMFVLTHHGDESKRFEDRDHKLTPDQRAYLELLGIESDEVEE